MNELSTGGNHLNLTLENTHRSLRMLEFLKNMGFKETDGIFSTAKRDADTIERVRRYFQYNNFELNLLPECPQILQDSANAERNRENLFQEARAIKERNDADFQNIRIPEFLPELELYPFQIKPVLHGLKLGNSANFSVPGSGKTWMSYATYFCLKAEGHVNKLLVICPQAGMQVWEEEYRHITGRDPAERIHRITSDDRDRGRIPTLPDRFEIILINYEKIGQVQEHGAVEDMRYTQALIRMLDQENHNFYLIADESHKIKDPQSNRGIAARMLSPSAARRLILTGTPMPNYHQGLWNQFEFLYPNQNLLGSYESFAAGLVDNPFNQQRAIDELDPLFTRITKNQLGLPPIDTVYLDCPMTEFQTEIYETIAWAIAQDANNRDRFQAYQDYERNVMYWIMASTDPSLLGENNQFSDALIDLEGVPLQDRIRRYAEGELSGKLSALQVFLRDIVRREDKIIIWCNFRGTLVKVQEMIERDFGVQVRKIDGSVDKDDDVNPLENKEKNLRDFRDEDDVNVLIANPASLAESISLHEVCHHAIYVDRTYVATNWIQSKERIHRVGMPDVRTKYTVLMSKYGPDDQRLTVDDLIEESLTDKERRMNDFLDDPGLNPNAMELNYDRINDPNDVDRDYRRVIEFLRGKFSNDQNN